MKQALLECVDAFGGRRMAGLAPNFLKKEGLGCSTGLYYRGVGGGDGGRGVKRLHLAVARIFTEKIQVYPHPSELVGMVDRNSNTSGSSRSTTLVVITNLLKAKFKAWTEQKRHGMLTAFSYRQIQFDVVLEVYATPLHQYC